MTALKIGRFKISCGFLLLLAALLMLPQAGSFLLLALFAALFHEVGHILAVKQYGAKIDSVTLTAAGAVMHTVGLPNYLSELFCVLSGCIFSFSLAILASIAGRVFAFQTAYTLSGLSLIFGIFNLLPALPLDGGRALHVIISALISPSAAEKTLFVTSLLTALGMLIIGTAVLLRTGSNFTLMAAGIYVLTNLVLQLGVENNRRVI